MTGKNLFLKHLKNRLFVFFAIIFSFNQLAHSQNSSPPASYVLDSLAIRNVINVSHDALGNIYLATSEGTLIKYSKQLAEEQKYSSASIPTLASLEATQMLKIFIFYQSSQQFQFFDRFLTPSPSNTIKTESLSYFTSATLSSDQMIWLFDENNVQLIKYNPILEEIILKVDLQYFLPADAQINGLKEYGNRLYLWQNEEILVFDFLGNLIQRLPIDVKSHFSFYQNTMYYAEGKQIFTYDLESMQVKKYSFSIHQEIKFVIRIDSKLYLITNDQIQVFRVEP